MTIKKFAEYMIENYNDDILEQYRDSKNMKKNRIKNLKKFKEVKESVPEVFAINDLITTFKPGPEYNYSEAPWIQIHDEKNKKGTTGLYIGISFNRNDKLLELWIGFGSSKYGRKEMFAKRADYVLGFKKIEPMLKRGFNYAPNDFHDAIIVSKNIPVSNIIDESVRNDLEYLGSLYLKYLNKSYFSSFKVSDNSYLNEIENPIANDKKISGTNIIYVGPPGCGKSHKVHNMYLTVKDEDGNTKMVDSRKYEVVTFHPEYTASNFIGSIMPITDNDEIKYDFVPGPFSNILKRAIDNPQSNFYLIIEEINRGNAAAIFGDIFVLLDRVNNNGESKYEISHALLAKFIYNEPTKKIKIPNNLSIIATMNSTDQNTMPLDSAFQRRWDTIWVLDEDDAEIDKLYIKGYGDLTWGKFRTVLNNKILKSQNNLYDYEDKVLSAYYISKSYLSENPTDYEKDRERFANNILTYLFLDVCKYNKTLLFKENINCISELLKKAKTNKLNIFADDIIEEFNK